MTTAMNQLMLGQHHNASVMQLYRACFRDDPDQLFGLITALNITTPEDNLVEITRAQELKNRSGQ
jgi:hypothetical protein